MLSYREALEFIHRIERFGSKPGLRRIRMLLERMGNPQKQLRFIHVAGSDGKGSTCTMLSHICVRAGLRTGLYISPYVVDFRERIQLDNAMIPPEELTRSTETVQAHWEALDAIGEPPTEFEVVVAVAMDYFVRMRCDIVILEVGMGGRFDATNVIDAPLCAVLTNISMDHMQYLGETLAAIAYEKCGIIKPDCATVSISGQHPEALAVIRRRCEEAGSRLVVGGEAEVLEAGITGSIFRYAGEAYRVPLVGPHQVRNAVTALEAIKAAGITASQEALQSGLAAVRIPSRVEVLGQRPLVLLDGGHNPAEATALAKTLKILNGRRIHAVVGMLRDKDVTACLQAVLPLCVSFTAVTPNYPRAMPLEELRQIGERYCRYHSVEGDIRTVLKERYKSCREHDAVLLCFGSLYLAGEARAVLLECIEE